MARERIKPVRALTVAIVRQRLKQRLLKMPGWNSEKADKALAKIGDGTILQWIKDHKGEILAVIKAAISIILLFADEPPI